MSQKREELIQRIAETHDTWFVEEDHCPAGHRYRLLAKEKGEPLFPYFMTCGQIHAFLDGYVLGLEHGKRGWR